jgi:hypothetical protein
VDGSLSLSNEMRCRRRVESAAPSDKLWETGGARRGKVGVCATCASWVIVEEEGRGSNEAPSGLLLLLLLGRVPAPMTRPVGEEW